MAIELYQEVFLTRNLLDKQLRKGDIALLIEYVPHPSGGERGAVLEIFNVLGESVDVVTVPVSAIAASRADQLPAVRPLLEVA